MLATNSGTLPPEDVFEILSNKRRRKVLYYLRKRGEPVEMKELAEQIAAIENEVSVDELTNQERQRVYVSLYQTHLPKMGDMGVIEYDMDNGIVRLTDKSDTIDRYLTSGQQSTYPWNLHYVALMVASGAGAVVALSGGPAFRGVPVLLLAGAVLAIFFLSVVVQYWTVRRQEEQIPSELGP